jgi:hypothetical protein
MHWRRAHNEAARHSSCKPTRRFTHCRLFLVYNSSQHSSGLNVVTGWHHCTIGQRRDWRSTTIAKVVFAKKSLLLLCIVLNKYIFLGDWYSITFSLFLVLTYASF